MNKPIVSIIMSVYDGDSLGSLREAVSSILNQTFKDFVFFIYVDGPVGSDVLLYLENVGDCRVHVFRERLNRGLSSRLNEMIDASLERDIPYIARMDADDIAYNNRIEKQLACLSDGLGDICGSSIVECYEDGLRKLILVDIDHDEMVRNFIKRSPLKHPTVVFKSSVFSGGLRYNTSVKYSQDYELWIRLIKSGFRFYNVEQPLLDFRVASGFYKRRGLNKAYREAVLRFYAMNELGLFSFSNVLHTLFRFSIRLSPGFIKKAVYQFRS